MTPITPVAVFTHAMTDMINQSDWLFIANIFDSIIYPFYLLLVVMAIAWISGD